MLGIDRRSVQNFDWTLLALIALLSAAGLVNLYSATFTSDGLSEEMRRQLVSFGIGAAVQKNLDRERIALGDGHVKRRVVIDTALIRIRAA